MTYSIHDYVEAAFRKALPKIKRSLWAVEIELPGTDEELASLLAGAVAGYADHNPKAPEPLDRHEKCLDCDAMGDIHRRGETHCTVCDEDWPCPDAGKIDEDHVAKSRSYIAELRANTERTPMQQRRMEDLIRRLEAEGLDPDATA